MQDQATWKCWLGTRRRSITQTGGGTQQSFTRKDPPRGLSPYTPLIEQIFYEFTGVISPRGFLGEHDAYIALYSRIFQLEKRLVSETQLLTLFSILSTYFEVNSEARTSLPFLVVDEN